MLSETEKEYARVLLNGLTIDDLLELSKTVTGSSLSLDPKNKEEAVDIILKFEEDTLTLLRRRKIKKELLCRYLHWLNVSFSPNAEKASLIKTISKLWTVPQEKSVRREENFPEERISDGSCASDESVSVAGTEYDQTVQSCNVTTSIQNSSSNSLSVENRPDGVETMAVKFAEWFYKMVNEDFWGRSSELLKGEHFFTDSQTVVRLISREEQEEFTATGGDDSATLIRETRGRHSLLLHPNLMPGLGVRGNTEPHGAIMVLACGTLHCAPDLCVGVFEQAFLLIRDPLAEDNWKIKKTDLRLRNAPGTKTLPSLADGELTKQLSLTS